MLLYHRRTWPPPQRTTFRGDFAIANYDLTFNARGDQYNQAMAACPDARHAERDRLLQLLRPQPGDCVIDAPAGGGYLAEAIAACGAQVLCVEPAARFAEPLVGRFRTVICPLHDLTLRDAVADRLGSLAGLHHLAEPQVARFFAEAFRVLRPGGRIAVADVKAATAPAAFLNGPVDVFTETGHRGRFFHEGDFAAHLASAGFVDVRESYERFTWTCPDHLTLVHFCRDLFGMTRATPEQVDDALAQHLQPFTDDRGAHLPWSLLYAVARKPG